MRRSAAASGLLALIGILIAAGCHGRGADEKAHESEKRVLYYVDPMHPSYRSEKPGIAPDCGMALEPVYEATTPVADNGATPGAVSINAQKQQLMGILVETVGKSSDARLVRTTGRVGVEEERLHRLMAGAEGWVVSVEDNPLGTIVKKDELLATLYSREYRNAQQAFLGSLISQDRMRTGHDQQEESGKEPSEDAGKEQSRGRDASLRINEEQLRALGMGEAQIRELRKKRQITSEITVSAPIDGIVLRRDISPGQRFDVGSEFYRIADLSKVWIIADVLGEDARAFRPGAKARVVVRERATAVSAQVSDAPPFFDAETRTLKVRLEADNPRLMLRPDMFVDVELPMAGAPALTVPIDALLDSGLSQRVFVEKAEGEFEPRVVQTGWRSGNRVEIVKGLAEGERVVARGTFLVDSESRLKTR